MPKAIIEGVDEMLDRKGLESGSITKQFLELKLKEHAEMIKSLVKGETEIPLLPPGPEMDVTGDDDHEEDDDDRSRYRYDYIKWQNGKYNRLPEGYILSRTANHKKNLTAIKRTPLQVV